MIMHYWIPWKQGGRGVTIRLCFEKGTDKYFVNNQTAPYVIGTFSKTGLFDYSYDFVAMSIIVKLTDDKILLVQYVANQDDFDKSLPKVEKVLESKKQKVLYWQ